MKAKEIAKLANCSTVWVYKISQKLGRYPTVEEVLAKKGKRGRPLKYKCTVVENEKK